MQALACRFQFFLGGLGLASLASGQAVANTQSAHAGLIKTLRQAHELLINADHDYDGHRAKAAEEVHNALKELGHHPKKANTGNGAATKPKAAKTGGGKTHESQATSDAQLQQALQLLQGTLTHLNSGKHPKAAAKVKAAITELNTALKIK